MDAKGKVEDVHDEAGGEADGVLGRLGKRDGEQQKGEQVDVGVDETEHIDVVAHQNLEGQQQEEAQYLFDNCVIHLPFSISVDPFHPYINCGRCKRG